MSTQTFKITNGVVSFAVFAMVAVAVIAGQARATGESAHSGHRDYGSAQSAAGLAATVNTRLLLRDDDLRYLALVPVFVNSLLDLPVRVEMNAETGALSVTRKPVPASEQ